MISNHNYRPGRYFTLTYLSTYLLWFAGAYLSFDDDLSGLYMLLMLPGLMAPFLISIVMMKASKNAELKKDHIDRLLNPRRIRLKMLPAFLFIMPLSVLASILISLLFGESIS
jgi:hypothetical protein